MVSQSWMMEQGLDPNATPYSLVPREVKSAAVRARRKAEEACEYEVDAWYAGVNEGESRADPV